MYGFISRTTLFILLALNGCNRFPSCLVFTGRSKLIDPLFVDRVQPNQTQISVNWNLIKSEKLIESIPSLIEVDEENYVITEASYTVSCRHGDDESEYIVNKCIECL